MHPVVRAVVLLSFFATCSLSQFVKRDYQVPEYNPNDGSGTKQVYDNYESDYYDSDKEEKIAKVIKGALIAYPIIAVIIAGMLLAALSFLFPAIVTITPNNNNVIGGRRRRSAELGKFFRLYHQHFLSNHSYHEACIPDPGQLGH